MDRPKRPASHILAKKSEKFLENCLPDEWFYTVPTNDYGIDYHIEIALNEQVTGLNFSIQLKSTGIVQKGDSAKVVLKKTTLNYYKVRLEPTMLVIFDAKANEAYWCWIEEQKIDLSQNKKSFALSVQKSQKLSEIDWNGIAIHVQRIFNSKSFIGDFDILKIDNNIELGAWKTYYDGDYEQAAYLFRRLIADGNTTYNIYQALAWSLYQTYQYNDALNMINFVLELRETHNGLKTKACILAEYGFRDQDKGKIIQARDIFKKFSNEQDSALMLFNYGNTLNALGNYDEAIAQYGNSLKKDEENAQCWKNLGTTYYNKGEHEKELSCYDKALSINPDLPQALFSKGITLAQQYGRYREALNLFHRVLDNKNNLTRDYVNGLFWVAYCYQELGDLETALLWIDRGLNHDGANPYFLNFKSNLLGRHWQNKPGFKEKAIEFFLYRIELENDPRSIYHYIEIQSINLEEALEFVQERVKIYRNIQFDDLSSISFSLQDLQVTLLQVDYYEDFRTKYPIVRYLDHILSPHFSISQKFFDLLELVFSVSFNSAITAYGKNNNELDMPKAILEKMLGFMPTLVDFLIPKKIYDKIDIAEILVKNFQGYTDLIFREIGAQCGHIGVNLGLRNIDPEEYIYEEYHELLGEKIYNRFIERMT